MAIVNDIICFSPLDPAPAIDILPPSSPCAKTVLDQHRILVVEGSSNVSGDTGQHYVAPPSFHPAGVYPTRSPCSSKLGPTLQLNRVTLLLEHALETTYDAHSIP